MPRLTAPFFRQLPRPRLMKVLDSVADRGAENRVNEGEVSSARCQSMIVKNTSSNSNASIGSESDYHDARDKQYSEESLVGAGSSVALSNVSSHNSYASSMKKSRASSLDLCSMNLEQSESIDCTAPISPRNGVHQRGLRHSCPNSNPLPSRRLRMRHHSAPTQGDSVDDWGHFVDIHETTRALQVVPKERCRQLVSASKPPNATKESIQKGLFVRLLPGYIDGEKDTALPAQVTSRQTDTHPVPPITPKCNINSHSEVERQGIQTRPKRNVIVGESGERPKTFPASFLDDRDIKIDYSGMPGLSSEGDSSYSSSSSSSSSSSGTRTPPHNCSDHEVTIRGRFILSPHIG